MPLDDYENCDGTELARRVREGLVSPRDLAVEARRRIDAVNPALNLVVHRFSGEESANLRGPFAGVPILLKDTAMAVRGRPLTSGSRLYADVVSEADGTLAARYRQAGFVFLGRTNVPELALSFTTESDFHGPARNPWDPARTPGGSTGGGAAVVAAGIVPIAQGSDGAGSIRVPAAHCGVFGFKPSRARNPSGPAGVGNAGMSTPHALTRSVRDCAHLLDAAGGPDVGDAYAAPPPERPFAQELERAPKGLRIGLILDGPEGAPYDADCRAGAEAAAGLCAALGHHVEPAVLEMDNAQVKWAWKTIAASSAALGVARFAEAKGIADPLALLEPVTADWIRLGRGVMATDYVRAVQTIEATSRAMGRFFQNYDLLLSPTTAQVAPPLGWLRDDRLGFEGNYNRFWNHAPHAPLFNASGCPGMSVPLHWTASGLPVGVQFGAAFGRDGLLIALAAELERAQPWAHRRPDLARALAFTADATV